MVGPQRGKGRLETHVLFFVAAVVAGLINSLAGGGGLITFPLLALVVPPVVADATSALALFPAYPSAVWRTRSKVREVRRLWLWLLLITSALGGLVRALLLVWTGERNLTFLVPWLVLGGTVLFVLEPRLSRRSGGAYQERGLATALWPLAAVVVFVVAIYGGYFGAGIGILMISALSLLRIPLGRTTVDRMSRCILYYDAARAPRSTSRCRRRYLLGCPWSVRTDRCPTSIARYR